MKRFVLVGSRTAAVVLLVTVWGLGQGLPVAAVAQAPAGGAAAPYPTAPPYPTLPGESATPEAEGAPLPTRPIGTGAKATKGKPIGPEVTFVGAARADGNTVEPISVDRKGIPTYRTTVGSGFMLVVEAKPGVGGNEVGRSIFAYKPDDPTVRPDLEVQATRDLGNGSPEVCDRHRPNIGGVPAINPTNFAEKQKISDAINDFACRFETFLEPDSACTVDKNGNFAFIKPDSTMQFCLLVAKAYGFPMGETVVTVRVRDVDGNPGPPRQVRIRRDAPPLKPARKPTPRPRGEMPLPVRP